MEVDDIGSRQIVDIACKAFQEIINLPGSTPVNVIPNPNTMIVVPESIRLIMVDHSRDAASGFGGCCYEKYLCHNKENYDFELYAL